MASIKNTEVYGMDESIKASWYPMLKEKYEWDIADVMDKDIRRANILAMDKRWWHANFLKWIVVQMDVEFAVKAWYELQRYQFIQFVSSMSLMHRLTQMDLDKVFNKYVTPEMVQLMKQYMQEYKDNPTLENELKLLYNCPMWVEFTARMTTNYMALRNAYHQRLWHKLPDRKVFTDWCETLPHAEWITWDNMLFEKPLLNKNNNEKKEQIPIQTKEEVKNV